MPSFPTLPTELRQQILHHALTIPLTPPTIPRAIPKTNWFYPVEERIYRNAFAHNREIGDYEPALSFNTRGPWGWQHLALLLVSQHFKKDVESVLKRTSSKTKPVVDVMVKSDLQISWLVAPPSLGQDLDCVEIRVRCFELFDPDNDGEPCQGAFPILIDRFLRRILRLGFSPYNTTPSAGSSRIKHLIVSIMDCTLDDDDVVGSPDERAQHLVDKLYKHWAAGQFNELSRVIDRIDVYLDDARYLSLSSDTSAERVGQTGWMVTRNAFKVFGVPSSYRNGTNML